MTIIDFPLADSQARERIQKELDQTFFVEAAAGTGKTTALVGRIMSVLGAGRGTLGEIVALTFTDKAAGEMKLRLRTEIEKARAADPSPEVAARLEHALQQLEEARIATIHAFCADILHERPVEAAVDPLFEVAPPDVSEQLLDEAFDDWFQGALADPPEGVSRIVRRAGTDRTSPRDALREATTKLMEHRDYDSPWRRVEVDRAALIDGALEQLAQAGELGQAAAYWGDPLARNLREIDAWVGEMRRLEEIRGRDYDQLEASLRELAARKSWRGKTGTRPFAPDVSRADALAVRDRARAELERVNAALEADLAPLLAAELRGAVALYEAAKARTGRLDFLDLLIEARNLVRDNPSVRAELQQRFTHFFVDEMQDTDPLQLELLLLLTASDPAEPDPARARPEPGKLFVVGDPKQSIYRFRRADVGEYERVKARLESAGAQILELTTNFRSLPGIQETVNRAFEAVMQADDTVGSARYVPLRPGRPAIATRPSVIALPVPDPYSEWGRVTGMSIDASYPDAVGAFVDWLTRESGWTVQDGGADVPVASRHVCILFRRLHSFGRDVARPYVVALENRGIAHVLIGGRSLHDREEIFAVRNALAAVEWPDDTLRVYATLRGPLFAFRDDTLLAYKARTGNLHPAAHAPDDLEGDLAEVAAALGTLFRLHRIRNRRPIADTLGEILTHVRAHAAIAIWPRGEQALANVLRVAELARRFEARGATSFRAFVEKLDDDAESVGAEEAPIVEEGTDGVRLMTVHKAKGLEFPVVILGDPTAPHTHRFPSQHVDPAARLWAESLCGCAPVDLTDHAELERRREAAEADRVAYVAATRARDLLVIPAVGDEERTEGWLGALNPAVYPQPADRRSPSPAAGCPPFGADSVRTRPPEAHAGPRTSVAPGEHISRAASRIVWWSPSALVLDASAREGVGQEDVLTADEGEVAVQRGHDAYSAWRDERARTIAAASTPTLRTATVLELARGMDEWEVAAAATGVVAAAATGVVDRSAHGVVEGSHDEAHGRSPAPAIDAGQVEVLRLEAPRAARVGGKRFGRLLHLVMAAIELDASDADIEQLARAHGRLVGAPKAEISAAAALARSALGHPLLVRAAGARKVRREVPIYVPLRTGQGSSAASLLAEGVIDLAFADGGGWSVVDFKTDSEIGAHEETYRRQVGFYTAGVSAATGEPARGYLLVL